MNKLNGNIVIILLVIGFFIISIVILFFYKLEQETSKIKLAHQEYKCEESLCEVKYNNLNLLQTPFYWDKDYHHK